MKAAKKNIQPIDTSTEVSLQEKAFLVRGTRQIPIIATCASKYSLFFKYKENRDFSRLDEPVNLLIRNNGQSVELGPCRILPGPGLNGYHGRLVFLRDVYDIQNLLKNQKVVKLQSVLNDLPLVLARKNKIRPSFKDYTTNLCYDLSVYQKTFDELDLQYKDEPEEIKRLVQKAILASESEKFLQFFQKTVDELIQEVSDFNEEEHQTHGFYFRKQVWRYILCSPLMRRPNLKPRGYAGDSEMMSMVYRNAFEGETTFGKLLHKYSVGIATGDSVRYRRKFIPDLLQKTRETISNAPGERTRVLSVACGPAWEVRDILASAQDFKDYHFTLLDQDQLALDEAFELISDIEVKCGAKAQAEYVNRSVRWMFGKRTFEQDLGKFHFIYSMGLFDYLVSRVAQAVLKKLYQLLIPGGEMVIGNFHVSSHDRYFLEYWGDWHLIYRTENELKNLFDQDPSAKVSVIYDKTGIQIYLRIKKY
jgi:extracellular factor (EF) 3-hydroxypalmitic acid methyl ester biosynthesis protein